MLLFKDALADTLQVPWFLRELNFLIGLITVMGPSSTQWFQSTVPSLIIRRKKERIHSQFILASSKFLTSNYSPKLLIGRKK